MEKEKKFCCEKMKGLQKVNKNLGLNLRIIKVSDSFINESKKRGFPFLKKENRYKFILTEGYLGKLDNKGQFTFINFCPFCGTDLKKYYKDDAYVNEDNHVW